MGKTSQLELNELLLILISVHFESSLNHLFQAKDIMTNYQTGVLENSAKMVLLFHLIDESVKRGDKMLVFRWEMFAVFMCDSIQMFGFFCNLFLSILSCQSCCCFTFTSAVTLPYLSVCDSCSQSLSTLTVMEDFLSRRPMPIQTETGTQNWVRNINYYSEFSNTL